MGGPSQEQEQAWQEQNQFYQTLTSEYSTLFGENQTILKSLTSTFEPILKAGPNQEGFSAEEKGALTSQAIEGTAKSYNQAKQALNSQIATQNGGTESLPSGANDQLRAEMAESAAANESNKMLGIEEADYEQGRQNFNEAAAMLGETSQLTNPTGAAGVANNAGEIAGTTANEIAQADNSWMGMVGGILGGAASAATSFGLGKLPK